MTSSIPLLVSTDWLAEAVDHDDIAVLDATKHLPAANRDPRAEFEQGHIPGARFLELASLKDSGSSVPDALPTAAQVAQRLSDLGVSKDQRIVLYDDSAVKTSARAWFALHLAGVKNIAILDGGLAKWRAEGRPINSGKAGELSALTPSTATASETSAERVRDEVRSKDQMLANLDSRERQILDARGADRVFGSGIDPVHGGQNGRIPGSLNLPFGKVFEEDGTFKPVADLRAAFADAGVDLDRPVVTTCGSGVTASVLLFALHLVGKHDVALYDGSWQEWSADPETPKVQGPQ